MSHSYIVSIKGYLFESPVTWFPLRRLGPLTRLRSGADHRFRPADHRDVPVLPCRRTSAVTADSDGRRPATSTLNAITCERCHGPAQEHVRQPSAANILNPRKLPQRARDSLCEQCHLEGDIRILNPGKNWRDFSPGEDLEQTMVAYILDDQGHKTKAVSQVEQLAQSRCTQ